MKFQKLSISNTQKGQATIESVFSTALILVAFKFTFYLLIIFWMKLWSNFNLHESLICRESQKSDIACRTLFHKHFKRGQFLFKIEKILWNKTLNSQSATLTTQDFLGRQHTYTKKVFLQKF